MLLRGAVSDECGDAAPSWHDTRDRKAIVDFVERVTTEGGAGYVPPAERIAVFDNDGTLWCEKPMPIELGFILQRLAEMAEAGPESLRERQPWQAAREQDYAWLGDVITKHYHGDDSDVKVLMGGILQAFAGHDRRRLRGRGRRASCGRHTTPRSAAASTTAATSRWSSCCATWRRNGFTNYIASGGDRDFMRPVTERDLRHPGRARHRQLERARATRTTSTADRSSTRPSWTSSTTAR